jgi:hypothetical protein
MLSEVQITPHLIGRFVPILGEDAVRAAEEVAAGVSARLAGRVIWHVSSTARRWGS